MEAHGVCPGLSPRPNIHLMENHDQAYNIWRDMGLRNRILVHIDAHDDVLWTDDQTWVNIGNFICPALKEDMVREIFWVVPDGNWETSRYLKPLVRRLKKIIAKYPGAHQPLTVENDRISTAMLGKGLSVCRLDHLPRFAEEVLLDIDVDYLITPKACSRDDPHQGLPWRWPAELVARLQSSDLRTDLVTIAYSIEGGYTPLKWKYLGDELAQRLQGPGDGNPFIQGMEVMQEAVLALDRGETGTAEAYYIKAIDLLPKHPAPCLHLAYLYVEQGRIIDAQQCYQRALALDPSYRTPYNSAGVWYYSDRRYQEAAREHRRTLILDPGDAYAHLGLGQLAAREKRWRDAEAWLLKVLELDSQIVDAHRTLGKVLFKQGRRQEAIIAYERSLQLTLQGYKPLQGPILTDGEDHPLLDPQHFEVHGILGRLYDLEKDPDTAIISYRLAVAAGAAGFVIRNRLCRVYLKQRQWRQAAQEGWGAVKMIPGDLRKAGRRSWRRLQRNLEDRFPGLKGHLK
jgi:tetratricopeptide (TPR) repeat protein